MATVSSQLRAFHETVRAGSIRKASEALGVAPSSVSRQIAILERQMGTVLLDRRAGGVSLTHAGTMVADYAASVLMDYDTLRTDLDDIRGAQRRLIKIALVESAATPGPVRAATALRETFPAVSFNIRLMPAPRVAEAVRQGECDIGLAFCMEPDPAVSVLASLAEPIVLAVSLDHPLAGSKTASLRDIEGYPLAMPDLDFGVRQIVDREAAAAGFTLSPVLTSNVFDVLLGFARRGAGVALLPMRAAGREVERGGLCIVPVSDAALRSATIDVVVLRKRRLPRVVKAFADLLVSEMAAAH